MTSSFPQRVAFEDHRFMRAVDLQDEQLYHLQRRWQHNLALHSWGILCGLEVRVNGTVQQQPNVIVYPGMALDGYGRELVVTEALQVQNAQRQFDKAVAYDIWLLYNATTYDSAASDEDCDDESWDNCRDAVSTNLLRIDESPVVLVRPTSNRQSGSVTEPSDVPQGDLTFSPERPLKFDSLSRWPVFLCQLMFRNGAWSVDPSERHYAGLIAERIEMPLQAMGSSAKCEEQPSQQNSRIRQTAILNGGHPKRKDWRFAVLDVPTPDEAPEENEAQKTKPRPEYLPDDVPAPLSIRAVTRLDKDKKAVTDTEICWQAERVVAEADVVMHEGAGLQFEATPVGDDPPPPTSQWGIYRSFRPPAKDMGPEKKGDATTQTDEQNQPGIPSKMKLPDANAAQFADVLQISMPKSESDTVRNSVAIGAVTADGAFSPILVVNDDESVEINGLLRVHGEIHGIPSDLPPINTTEQLQKLAEKLTPAIKKNDVTPGVKHQLVVAVATGMEAAIFADSINTIPDHPSGAATKVQYFQAIISTAGSNMTGVEFGAGIDGVTPELKTALYQGLITSAGNSISANLISEAVDNVESAKKLPLYQQLVTSAGNSLTELDFVQGVGLVEATRKASLYQELVAAAGGVVTDAEFAAAVGKVANQPAIYEALGAQILTTMAPDDFHAEEFVNKLIAAHAATVGQTNFCKAMLTRGLSALDEGFRLSSLSKAATWPDLLTAIWKDAAQTKLLGNQFVAGSAATFVSGLSEANKTALRNVLLVAIWSDLDQAKVLGELFEAGSAAKFVEGLTDGNKTTLRNALGPEP